MPRRSIQSYSSKQKRTASQLGQGSKKKGRATKNVERIVWATVSQRTRTGKKRGRK